MRDYSEELILGAARRFGDALQVLRAAAGRFLLHDGLGVNSRDLFDVTILQQAQYPSARDKKDHQDVEYQRRVDRALFPYQPQIMLGAYEPREASPQPFIMRPPCAAP
jgi:hypothetical protein